MATKGAPRSDGEETRARLLTTTRDMVLEVGPDNVSLREVARRVGISAPAVYRHFDDKDALILAACQQGFLVFSSYLVRALAEPTPLLRLRACGANYLRFGLENERDYRFIFMSQVPRATSKGAPKQDTTFQFLVDRVSECMKARILRKGDTEAVAATIWAHVHGLVSLRLSGHLASVGNDKAFAEFYHHAVDELLRGLGT